MNSKLVHCSSLALLSAVAFGCANPADGFDPEGVETAYELDAHHEELICLTCDDPEPTPVPRQPVVAAPAFIMEFEGCAVTELDFSVRRGPLLSATVAALQAVDAVGNGNGDKLKIADYAVPASIFMTDVCRNNKHIFGTWIERLGALGTDDTSAARKNKLSAISVAQTAEQFAFRVQPSAVNQLVSFAWADIPKSMDMAGAPTSNGPVFLDSVAVSYPTNKSLQLAVKGHANTSVGSVPFTATLLDTMALTSGQWISCSSDVDLDLEGFAGNVAETFNAIFNIVNDPDEELGRMLGRGPACRAIDALEQDPLLPGLGLKTLILLSRLQTSSATGTTIAGTTQIAPRAPVVTITGDSSLVVEPGDEFLGEFGLRTDDIMLPLKSIKWSGTGATFTNPYSTKTFVTWSTVPGPAQQMTKTITVTVVDAENKTTTGTRNVYLKRLTY